MKKTYTHLTFISLIVFQTLVINAQSPDWLWANSAGNNLNDYGRSITTDVSGNVYVTGSFKGTVDFDPGPNIFSMTSAGDLDVFIIKYDNLGNFVWAKSFNGQFTDEGLSIDVDASGNIYTTGHFQSTVDFDPGANTFNLTATGAYDIFLSKLNSSGDLIWAKQIGGNSNDEGLSLVTNATGDVFMTGYFGGVCDFNPDIAFTNNLTSAGSSDIFLCRFDSSGAFIWAGRMGGTGVDFGESVTLHVAGFVCITGHYAGSADFDPGTLSFFNLTSVGSKDIFIARYSGTGNFSWAKSMGSSSSDQGFSIIADGAGNLFTTGHFNGTADFSSSGIPQTLTSNGGSDIFITKHDNTGTLIWVKQIGDANNDEGKSLVLDETGQGKIYSTGNFSGTVDFDPSSTSVSNLISNGEDFYILALDTGGNYIWAKHAGGSNADYGQSITTSTSGEIYLTGWFHSDVVSFGTHTVTNAVTTGFSDLYVARLNNVISGMNSLPKDFIIDAYPNPATDHFCFILPETEKEFRVLVYDVSGKIFYSSVENNSNHVRINTEGLANGIYFVQILTDNFSVSKKMILEN